MSRLDIGRVGGCFDSNIESLRFDGELLRVRGRLGRVDAVSDADVRALQVFDRQQVLALNDSRDEPWRVVRFRDDPTVNGVYVVEGASADLPPGGLVLGGHVEYDVGLRRISDRVAFEALQIGGWRSNAAGYDSSNVLPVHSVPAAYYTYWGGWTGLGPAVERFRDLDNGRQVRTVALSIPANREWQTAWTVPAENTYDGSPTIEVLVAGRWLPMSGRVIPQGATWRITNGIVRLTMSSVTDGTVRVETWNPGTGQWVGSDFRLGTSGFGLDYTRLRLVTVNRNSSERAGVRLVFNVPSYGFAAIYDVTLVRGEPFVRFYAFAESFVATTWGNFTEPTVGHTDLTTGAAVKYGARATTAVNGVRWYMLSSQTLTGGAPMFDAAGLVSSFHFAIGNQLTTLASTTLEQHPDLVKQYLAPLGEYTEAVAR